AEIRICRIGNRSRSATIHYQTSDGTAHAGVDYTSTEGLLEFAPLDMVKTIRVSLAQNRAFHGIRTFRVTLFSPSIPSNYDRPVEVQIYDREVGLVLEPTASNSNGNTELGFDVTGLRFVEDYLIEGSPDLRDWTPVPSQNFRGGLFSSPSILIDP